MNGFTEREKKFSAEELRSAEHFPDFKARNIRFKNGAYRRSAATTQGADVQKSYLRAVGQSYDNVFLFETKTRVRMRAYHGGGAELSVKEPTDVFPVHTITKDTGGFGVLFGTKETFYYVTKSDTGWGKVSLTGGLAGCQHNMRVFIATADYLYYTEVGGLYTLPSEKSPPAQSGRIYLPDGELGTVLRMVSLGDRIALVRERGISLLLAYGDPLNFRFLPPVQGPGGVIKYTVCTTGREVYYISEWGLTVFDGEKIRVLPDRAFREIRLTSIYTGGCVSDGKFYANVVLQNGEKWLYCYDFAEKEGHIFCKYAAAAFVSRAPSFVCNHHICTIGETSGFSNPDEPLAWMETGGFSAADGKDYLLREFTADADGSYTVEIRCENGSYTAEGSGRIVLPRPLRGKRFSVKFSTEQENFALRGFSLRGAEAV